MMRRALAATPILAAVVLVAVGPAGTRHRLAGADRPATERSEPAPAPRPFGIDKRVPLTTSTVVGFPDPPPPYRVVRSYPDLKPDYPIMVRVVPGSTEALVITQPHAYGPTTLSRLTLVAGAKELTKLFATPDGGTAYDIAFHPHFADNGFVYIGWNGAPKGQKKRSIITRYTMTTKPPYAIDTAQREGDHRAGNRTATTAAAVCFGKDGMLYVTSRRRHLRLRHQPHRPAHRPACSPRCCASTSITPRKTGPYSVPKDNPFVGDRRFAPETWAYGLRNPWRISYDADDRSLWVGQNGQDLWEQAYLVEKGANYGWSVMEGSHPFYPNRKAGPTPFVKPTAEHHHSEARSLTGGVVYHGTKFPDLQGAYIYGDYSTGRIWAMKHDGKAPVWHKEIAATTLKITGFAFDSEGELLICHHGPTGDGGFYTLEPNRAKDQHDLPAAS